MSKLVSGDRRPKRDLAFLVFVALYTTYVVVWLLLGLLIAAAAAAPWLQDGLRRWGEGGVVFSGLALRVVAASRTVDLTGQVAVDYLLSAVGLGLGLLLVRLRPRERAARLLAVGMIGTAAAFNLQSHDVYKVISTSDLQAADPHFIVHAISGATFVHALLLFPDDRLVPEWTRRFLPVMYLLMGLTTARALEGVGPLAFFLLFFGLLIPVVGISSQAYRYRHAADAEERQQARLLAWALTVALGVGLVFVALNATMGLDDQELEFAFRVFQPVLGVIPIALFVGILRYRLWDIDRIINRALVYGALAAFITVVYVGVVVGVGAAVGRRGSLLLSIAASTVIALAFEPVREETRRLANRLVYGTRATPYMVLTEFSKRVGETYADNDALVRMARVLGEATGAAHTDVWLKVESKLELAASWPGDPETGPRSVDLAGKDLLELPGADRTIPVHHRGEFLGALSVTKPPGEQLSQIEDKLLSDLASQAGLVLRNVALTAELQARLDTISAQALELRASRQRIVATADEERRRLERNIHDGAQQHLVAIAVKLGLAKNLAEKRPEQSEALLSEVRADAANALEILTELARGIYPPLLEEQGLGHAMQVQGRKLGLPVEVAWTDLNRRYSPEVETAVYFCCLEALQNVAKHAEASSARVELEDGDGQLEFRVVDDGSGFDMKSAGKGAGVQNMIDRIEGVGGKLEFRSSRGSGTTVSGSIPQITMEETA